MKKNVALIFTLIVILICGACSDKKEDGISTEKDNRYEMTKIDKPEGVEFVKYMFYEENSIYVIGTDQKEESTAIWKSSDGGNTWNIHPDVESSMDVYIEDFFSQTSCSGDYLDAAKAGDILFILIQNQAAGKEVWKYDTDSKEAQLLKSDILTEYLDRATGGGCIAADQTGTVLYAESEGIIRYDIEADQISMLMEADELEELLDIRNEPVIRLAVDEDRGIMLCTRNVEKSTDELFFFSKDTGTDKKQEKQKLTVYSLKDNSMIRQSLQLYEESNPNVSVEYRVGYTGTDGVTVSDAIRNLNTEIMAGTGPDILVLDSLPWKEYVEKGILENISDIVDKNQEILFKNVVDSCNQNDLYVLPTTFTIPFIIGNEEVSAAQNTTQLIECLKRQTKDVPVMAKENFPTAAIDLFVTSGIGKAELQVNEVAQYYCDMDALKELCGIDSADIEKYSLQKKAQMYPYLYSAVGLDIYMGRAQSGITTVAYSDNYIEMKSAGEEKNLNIALLNQNSGNSFIPSEILGINAMSGEKNLAKDFMEFYISQNVQDMNTMGFSINRKSMKQGFAITDESEEYYVLYDDGTNTDLEDANGLKLYTLTEENFEKIVTLIETLNSPVQVDVSVLEAVMEQADRVLFDGVDAEVAAEKVCNEVNLYLNE